MLGFLFANLFLVALVLIAAGLFLGLGALVNSMHLPDDYERWAFVLVSVLSIFGCYYIGKTLHRFIEKRLKPSR